MVGGTEDGGYCAITVRGSVLRTIGEEACERELFGETDGGSGPLQIRIGT
jgi:hypothetical protein